MTRRILVFTDSATGKTYKTPEFNGDRAEFIQFMGKAQSCDADWADIIKEFEGVCDLQTFCIANIRAQQHYHSPYDDELLPVQEFACADINLINGSMGMVTELYHQ